MTTINKEAVLDAALNVDPNDPFYRAMMVDAEAVHMMSNPPLPFPDKDGWISVYDPAKPAYWEKVLACFSDEKEAQICLYGGVTHLDNGRGGKIRTDVFCGINNEGKKTWESTEATHWMTFPKPPKKELA